MCTRCTRIYKRRRRRRRRGNPRAENEPGESVGSDASSGSRCARKRVEQGRFLVAIIARMTSERASCLSCLSNILRLRLFCCFMNYTYNNFVNSFKII